MAGSRLEKIGTIFNRVNGLLRSGALDPAERPIWFDVYHRFPPKVQPEYERPIPSQELRQIVYPEDLIRLNFYKIYGDSDVIDLKNESKKTTCQLFVDKYIALLNTAEDKEDLFMKTAETLKGQGVKLKNVNVKEVQEETLEDTKEKNKPNFSVKDILGDIPKKKTEDQAKNIMFDNLGLE
ncbi:hypothetical protein LOTGIDRAFT_231528 [Lottia gigantea]|uniref:Small ribosomal subunit protein mS23 n=1 Tax=Lottia gigantea TaxID=225164 RepID=V4AJS7_LOTGI|nr:hypothetical protein LOTGIDRAFT_231528 [Lottia gigantea]ESO97332.1 hypothetical protein LOTGIDRAFT_231528 [Lottia gigantea]